MLGYVRPLSVAPGETLSVMLNVGNVAGWSREETRKSVVRLISADTAAAGPGLREELCDWHDRRHFWSAYRPNMYEVQAYPGSYARIGGLPRLEHWTVSLFFLPTLRLEKGEQTLVDFDPFPLTLAVWKDQLYIQRRVSLDPGRFRLYEMRFGQMPFTLLGDGFPLTLRRWHWFSLGASGTRLRACLRRLPAGPGEAITEVTQDIDAGEPTHMSERLFFGARRNHFGAANPSYGYMDAGFYGRIELPWLADRALDVDEAWSYSQAPERPTRQDAPVVAAWDFSREMEGTRVVDIGPHAHDGVFVNHPTRAVRGVRWDGSEHCWKRTPDHYGAAHFHADDLTDAGWIPAYEWEVPAHARSGIYAVKLKLADDVEYVPFFVRAPAEGPYADVLLLLPTATYLAYANNRASIALASALAHAAYDNEICRIATNVLRRFTDPARFEMPGSVGTHGSDVPAAGSARPEAAPRAVDRET